MNIKIHKTETRDIIAICDKDLIGKTLTDGNLHLEVSERFYKGKEISEAAAVDIIREGKRRSSIFNILGKRSVDFALKNGIIDKENIIKIKDIPHAQSI
ncbi:DUF424 family protein [Candidatus Woesearchaeota archaeon]|nr:DUF424 family protein [Candidatus Woesearchaeota archaeon]